MGLFSKSKSKKKKAKAPKKSKPSVTPCEKRKSWIKFHVYDATPTVTADFENLGITVSNLANVGKTLRTAEGTGKAGEKFDFRSGTYDAEEIVNPVNDYIYFVTEESAS